MTLTDLGTLDGDRNSNSRGFSINASGQVAGDSSTNAAFHAVRWTDTTPTDLGTLGGRDSSGLGINASGEVTGWSGTADGYHAVRWIGTVPTDLGTLGGNFSAGYAINDSGQVAGNSTAADGTQHAVRWTGTTPTDLGALSGNLSFGFGINASGQVVGYTSTSTGQHAFLYSGDGPMQDLNDLLPPDAGVVLTEARAINDAGQIVCNGYGTGAGLAAGQSGVFVLTPIRPLVFIPGIAGSRLIGGGQTGSNGNGNYLWPTLRSADIRALKLGRTADVEAVDVLRSYDPVIAGIGEKHFYDMLIEHLTGAGFPEFPLNEHRSRMTVAAEFENVAASQGPDRPRLFPFPYDWRQANESHMATLHAYIQNIRKLHGDVQVDLLAHSMGGLVARRYAMTYPEDVNRVVTVATPYWGAPVGIYRMLIGGFYEVGLLDAWNNSAFTEALPTLPAFHELLPTRTYLLNGGLNYEGHAFLTEEGWDLNKNQNAHETYADTAKYEAAITATVGSAAVAQNTGFHTTAQDDWRGDNNDIRYLHICGVQNGELTPVGFIAKASTLPNAKTEDWLKARAQELVIQWGRGDGVVPLLSARRSDAFLDHPGPADDPATRTLTRIIYGPPDDVQHTALTQHPLVFQMIDQFLRGEPVPTAPPAGAGAGTQRVSISGAGFVRIVDAAGHENTKVGGSDMMAKKIPGVEVFYGGENGWVEIIAPSGADLRLYGDAPTAAVKVQIVEWAADGTASSLRSFAPEPSAHGWETRTSPPTALSGNGKSAGLLGVEPVMTIDTNDNGIFEVSERIPPTYSSGAGPVDLTAPSLGLLLTASASGVVATFSASDETTPNPTIRYAIDDGAAQTYSAPLAFSKDAARQLKAFAEDAMGNTSGLIVTTINPVVSIAPGVGATLDLQWPAADGYALEEAASPDGTWTTSTSPITNSGVTNKTSVPLGTNAKKFFRLRSQQTVR